MLVTHLLMVLPGRGHFYKHKPLGERTVVLHSVTPLLFAEYELTGDPESRALCMWLKEKAWDKRVYFLYCPRIAWFQDN